MASRGSFSSLSFLSKMSEETFDFVCTACDKDNRTLEAVRYCVECLGYCCQECTNLHSRFPALKNHNLLDVGQGNQNGNQQPKLPEFPIERCHIHQGKVLDMYCEHHDVVGCSTCISKDHRSCPHNQIHSIPDMIGSLFNKSRRKEVQANLKELMVSLTAQAGSKDDQLATLRGSRDKALKEVTQFQHALETVVKTLAEISRQEVEEMYNNIEKEILKAKTDIMMINNGLQEASDKLDKSDGNRAQQFACTKIAEKKITKTGATRQKSNGNTDVKLSFIPNQSLIDFIDSLQGIGEVRGPSRIKTDLYKVKESKDINIKMPGEPYPCDAEGCCLISENQLLAIDYYNKKLKLVDLQTLAVVDVYSLSSEPRQVCSVKENEAVVTFPNKTIQFVSIDGNRMELTRQIKMPHECYGISTKDEKIYVTDNRSSLYIYDMNGKLMVTMSQNKAGNELFSDIRHISFTESGDKMYVSDSQKGIACFDEFDNYQSTFNDVDVIGAYGTTSDGRGNIFAVGYNSHNVVQFNEAGEKIGVVIKKQDGLQYPQSICFDKKLSRLFVTMYSSDEMKIYELE